MPTLREQRKLVERLLDPTSPADAPTAYYALYHDPQRSALFVRTDAEGRAIGFAGRFQTGVDLFRPVVVTRCPDAELAADLLAEALTVGRPYIFFGEPNQLPLVSASLQIDNRRILAIYELKTARFTPVINVLVVTKTAPDGSPRAEIHSGGLQAVAGVNWQSPYFAELYVHTEAEARQRGWGRSVVAACTQQVLAAHRRPLYLVEPDNEASISLAEGLGYMDTGARMALADTVYLGHPAKTNEKEPD
jgi:hypothetical protein